MVKEPIRKRGELDARSVGVNLSEGTLRAFRDLESAVHFSEHFRPEELETLHDLASGRQMSVDDLLGTFYMLARPVFTHILTMQDKRAQKAWNEIGSHLLEDGLTLRSGNLRSR